MRARHRLLIAAGLLAPAALATGGCSRRTAAPLAPVGFGDPADIQIRTQLSHAELSPGDTVGIDKERARGSLFRPPGEPGAEAHMIRPRREIEMSERPVLDGWGALFQRGSSADAGSMRIPDERTPARRDLVLPALALTRLPSPGLLVSEPSSIAPWGRQLRSPDSAPFACERGPDHPPLSR